MKVAVTILGLTLFAMCKEPADNAVLKLDAVLNTVSQVNDKIVYSCWDTAVKVFDPITRSVVFNKRTAAICYAKPTIKNGNIYFPYSDDKFVCARLGDGAILWEKELKGRCSNFDFIADSIIAASEKNYGLCVFNASNGQPLYELRYNYAETNLPDVSPWPLSFDENNFYLSNWQGNIISSYKKKDGSLNWQMKSNGAEMAGKSIVLGNRLFVGVNRGYQGGMLVVMDAASGKILQQQECSYEDKLTPVVHEQSVYFYSYDGFLNRYDDKLTRIKKVDLNGNQLFVLRDELFFSDASYYINRYSIKENKFYQLQKTEKPLTGIWGNNNVTHFIN